MEVVEAEQNPKKRPLTLDFDNLIDDDPPLEIVVILKEEGSSMDSSSSFHKFSDQVLEETIRRNHDMIKTMGPRLPDKGKKIRDRLKLMETERECRKLNLGKIPLNLSLSQTNCEREKASDKEKEVSTLNDCVRELAQKERQNGRPSSRQDPFQIPSGRCSNGEENVLSTGGYKGKVPSICSQRDTRLNSFRFMDDSQVQPISRLRRKKTKTVVEIDEDDEPEQLQDLKDPAEQRNGIAEPECVEKEVKIYYPSRDDPESVEIAYEDMDCLAPEAYLSSPVMNFYIRYIRQVTPNDRARCNYHVFNTYFYKKLKEAVAYKGNDKDGIFDKFRRWWKGVDLFQKAYVLIPIHDALHWSLVIICVRDKEEEDGPIILHLDSLGFHCSRSIFKDIKSFLRNEWDHLKQAGIPLDLPFSDKVWRNFPRRIEEKKIMVPQQKNDYDCGLFVLYFMERFIEEAPERLKNKNLAMFGKQWFRSEEASSLRVKIRKILKKEFETAIACNSESSSSPKSVQICD
ncbi:LOW QUALITY PROTEIN: ubiquitin-like-specific protease 1D [Rutidosis leptorrhynchoides]|uniref:LOW QUALITY PROTEIN: ubiquitin-like-specific protease 1D n=1 Tax=Rutidosis leptorrhynchoides TaxID=125765 RepID=UPI003A9A1973